MARFTAGEMEVMRILWEHGELKPAEIQKQFPRPIKNAALRSYLTILVEKGHLTRRSKGKAFYYRPKTKRESTFRSMLGELVNTFCGGSSEALLCHLLAKEKLPRRNCSSCSAWPRNNLRRPKNRPSFPGGPSHEHLANGFSRDCSRSWTPRSGSCCC